MPLHLVHIQSIAQAEGQAPLATACVRNNGHIRTLKVVIPDQIRQGFRDLSDMIGHVMRCDYVSPLSGQETAPEPTYRLGGKIKLQGRQLSALNR